MIYPSPKIFLVIFLISSFIHLDAASAYDDCTTAFNITNVKGWCSSPSQFTNVDARASQIENPDCFPSFFTDADNDVWFKFKAVATLVNISVIGAIKNNPGGTLQYPQLAVYQGKCPGKMQLVACISDSRGYHIVETFVNNLVVGETYYLRVDGRNNRTGTFQLCVNNFNPVPSPSSDCATAVVLCDKSPFTVPSVTGAGLNQRELPRGICLTEESQSVWYKWTCEKAGTLTFTLKPINPSDDLDFALFMLPGGVSNCNSKVPVRCMASGENVGQSFQEWKKCAGATGLRFGSTDVMEDRGCNWGDDNFLAPLQMEAGKSYALVVNNYHNTGNGFSVEFGGDGTFVGPVAHFTVSKLKIKTGQKLLVKNASSFSGGIKKWEWNFGLDASPQSARGEGPHRVSYSSDGKKSISLSIETGNGCQVTKVREIEVLKTPPPPPPPPKEPEPEPEPEGKPDSGELTPNEEATPAEDDSDEQGKNEAPTPVLTPPKSEEKVVEYQVKYEATVFFKSDSSALAQKDYEVLHEVLDILRENPQITIIVEGHTNSIPSEEYCMKLGAARANSVIHWLESKGIAEDRITQKVFGKQKVVSKDLSLRGRQRYQRAVIKLLEKAE